MIATGVRDLKNRLSHYLRLVQAGQHVLVTDHGRVIAELGPAPQSVSAPPPAIATLLASGSIRRPTERGSPLADWPIGPPPMAPGTARLLIDEDREESWNP
jgi:prevent-host-death family protein